MQGLGKTAWAVRHSCKGSVRNRLGPPSTPQGSQRGSSAESGVETQFPIEGELQGREWQGTCVVTTALCSPAGADGAETHFPQITVDEAVRCSDK